MGVGGSGGTPVGINRVSAAILMFPEELHETWRSSESFQRRPDGRRCQKPAGDPLKPPDLGRSQNLGPSEGFSLAAVAARRGGAGRGRTRQEALEAPQGRRRQSEAANGKINEPLSYRGGASRRSATR